MVVIIGVDIGQRREPTAICAVEVEDRRITRHHQEEHFVVRYLERMTVGTSYPAAAQQTAKIASEATQRGGGVASVYVDVTGLGQPVVSLFWNHVLDAHVTAVYFTHGDRRHVGDSGEVVLGKAYLVARLQTLLQTGCLHLPRTVEAEQLARDLLEYEIQVSADANDHYGAFKVGRQDDLVTALGLAVQGEVPRSGILFPMRTTSVPLRVVVPLLGGAPRLLD